MADTDIFTMDNAGGDTPGSSPVPSPSNSVNIFQSMEDTATGAGTEPAPKPANSGVNVFQQMEDQANEPGQTSDIGSGFRALERGAIPGLAGVAASGPGAAAGAGAGAAIGGVVGGAAGAIFGGGVGAIPGAAAGIDIGADIGGLVGGIGAGVVGGYAANEAQTWAAQGLPELMERRFGRH